ncbi:hypothetical protein LMJ43_37495, partial [Streptomyces rochei]|nr:hypothetical protein [Streptomyces rochei]
MSNTTTTNTSVITDYTDDSDKFLLFGDLNFSSLTFVQVGVNTEIRVNNFALTLLLNVNATILNAGDFLGVNVSGNNNVSTPTPTPGLRVVTPPSFNQTIFNFAGNTVAQVIVGSTTLANNITGGDAGNDITG